MREIEKKSDCKAGRMRPVALGITSRASKNFKNIFC